MNLFLALIYVSSFFGIFTTLFFMMTLYEGRHTLKSPKPNKLPLVTVIVPAFNEQGRIQTTINSLLSLNYPKKLLEIIMVNDGSTDGTWNEMQRFKSDQIKIFSKKNGGKASALNYGIKHASGEIIISLDADSFVDKNALINMVGYFNNPAVMAVTPAMKVWKPKTILQKIQFVEYTMGNFLRKAAALLNCIHVTPGPFSAYRKSFFEQYGGYKEGNLTEDMEVALRIQSNNYVIENAQNAYSYTIAPSQFSSLYKQRVRWYLGFLNNIWDYRHLFSSSYGLYGLFYLPAALISVVLTISLVSYVFGKLAMDIYTNVMHWTSINFDLFRLFDFKFDIFYLPPGMLMMISILTLLISISMIWLGKRITEDKENITAAYVYSMLLYSPLYALWWLASCFHKVRGKNVRWSGMIWKKD